MTEQDKQAPIVHNTFNAPIGQYVQYQHIEHMTIGSDGQIQVASSSQPAPHPESSAQPSYTRHIETTASITAIGKLLVADANSAKTKAEFINKISEIVQRTQLFTFKPNTSNQEKADFTNAILAAYGYKGTKCANITDDDFQRYF
jgi:hypothetical protein